MAAGGNGFSEIFLREKYSAPETLTFAGLNRKEVHESPSICFTFEPIILFG